MAHDVEQFSQYLTNIIKYSMVWNGFKIDFFGCMGGHYQIDQARFNHSLRLWELQLEEDAQLQKIIGPHS